MKPAVTIGLPCRNGGSSLYAAIQSIFSQSLTDWELLLVDDGSDDGSVEYYRKITDQRVCVISDGNKKGLSYRLNQIADIARGKYLARMDADDMMHPQRLEAQFAALEAHPALDLIGSCAYSFGGDYAIRGVRRSTAQSAMKFLKHNLIIHPTLFGKADWWRKHQYDPAAVRGEDKELWAREFETLGIDILPRPLLFYREEAKPITGKFIDGIRTELKIFRSHGPRLVGCLKTAMLHAHLLLRASAHCATRTLGLQELLIGSRTQPLTSEQMRDADLALRQILKQELPVTNCFA